MAKIFRKDSLGLSELLLCVDEPLRLDARGDATRGEWLASIVCFAAGSGGAQRFALVAVPGARVWRGARRVHGVAELVDGDHIFVGDVEWILGCDAHPSPVASAADEICPICCECVARVGALHACPRCGARSCAGCWRGFANGRCATRGCVQPADMERELSRPAPEDFVSGSLVDREEEVQACVPS